MPTEITNLIMKADSSEVAKASKNLDDLEKSAKKAQTAKVSLSNQAMKMATSFFGVVAAIALVVKGLKAGFDRSAEFTAKFAEVRTLLDETKISSQKLTTEMQGLSGAFGTMAEKASGLYQAISAGIEGENSVKFLGTAAQFAKAGVTDLTTSVDLLTTAMNSYGMGADRAGYVSDILFETIKRGKTTASELGHSFGRVLATASAVGITFEELNAAVAALTASGVRTNETMSSLKQVIVNIAKPSGDAIDTAEKLGIEFGVASLQSKGLAQFLTELVEKTKGNTQAQADLFGSVEAFNAIAVLTSQSGMARFTAALDGMKTSAGNTFTALEKFQGDFGYEWERFWNNMFRNTSGVAGSLGKVLQQMNDAIELQSEFEQALNRNEGRNAQMEARNSGQGNRYVGAGLGMNVGTMSTGQDQETQFREMMARVKTINHEIAADISTGMFNMLGISSRYGAEIEKLIPQMKNWGVEVTGAMAQVVEYNQVMEQEKKLIELVTSSGYTLEQQAGTYAPMVMDLVAKHKSLTDEGLDPVIAKLHELALAMEEVPKPKLVSEATLAQIDELGKAAAAEQLLVLGFQEEQEKAVRQYNEAQVDAIRERLQKAAELAVAEQIQQLEADEIRLEEKVKSDEKMLEAEKRYREELQKLREDAANMEINLNKKKEQMQLQARENFFNNLAGLMNTSNKKMFEIGKAAAIAQAVVKGHEAILSAYAAGMATTGPHAPIVAAAYAAAAAIQTANLIANIASSTFGGGGGMGTSIGQGSSGYTQNGYFASAPTNDSNNQVLIELTDAIRALQGIPPGQVVTMGISQAGGLVAVTSDNDISELASEITGSVYV